MSPFDAAGPRKLRGTRALYMEFRDLGSGSWGIFWACLDVKCIFQPQDHPKSLLLKIRVPVHQMPALTAMTDWGGGAPGFEKEPNSLHATCRKADPVAMEGSVIGKGLVLCQQC